MMSDRDTIRLYVAVAAALLLNLMGCAAHHASPAPAELLLSKGGLDEWKATDQILMTDMLRAADTYHRTNDMSDLLKYDQAVRLYVDHGFALYRTYKPTTLRMPSGMTTSLEKRITRLMNVAAEYLHQDSIPMGVGIAREIVVNYSDLPVMTVAQHRAEVVLLEYSYRTDY